MEVSKRVTAERLLLLGWTRAILLQLAHPLIAAGVCDHSGFRASPVAAAARLHHTVRAMLDLTFGDEQTTARALDGIRTIHTRVHGQLRTAVGPFAAGTPYSAEDSPLLVWVHATLVESMLVVYEQLVAPLAPAERDDYCAEAAWVAVALGARPEDVPRTWTAMRRYIDDMLASGAIVVSPEAFELSRALLWPSLAWTMPGSGHVNRLFTAALLPPSVREQYHLPFDARQARRFAVLVDVIGSVRRVVPTALATWRVARKGLIS